MTRTAEFKRVPLHVDTSSYITCVNMKNDRLNRVVDE